MKVRHQIADAEGYLLITTGGRWGRQNALHLIDIVAAECRKRGHARALIDGTELKGRVPDFDRYVFGAHVAAVCEGIRLAAVIREEYINKFAENVAVNRGASFFVTSSHDEALQWLMADSPDNAAEGESK